MTGETATRIALAVAIGLGLALAATLVLSGDPTRSGPPGATVPAQRGAPAGVSPADAQLLSQTRPWIRQWNSALNTWLDTFGQGRERFLGRYSALTQRMDVNSLRIRLSASRLANPRLRGLMRRLGNAYRQQFRAVVAANAAVEAGDSESGRQALLRLERADQAKTAAATALADAFPELVGDLNRLR